MKLKSFFRFLGLCLFPILLVVEEVFMCIYAPEFWMELIGSLIVTGFLFFFAAIGRIYHHYYRYFFVRVITAFASAVFTLINVLYEFWYSEIIFRILKVKEIPLILIILFVLFVIIKIIFSNLKKIKENRRKAKREARMEAEKKVREEKRKAEEEKIKAERLEQIKKLIESINSKEQSLWSEILPVARYYILCPSKLVEILPKVPFAPLEQVIKISRLKKQIVWTGDLETALEVIEIFSARSYNDEELKLFMKQIGKFLEIIEECKGFKGYEDIMKLVVSKCPTVSRLRLS